MANALNRHEGLSPTVGYASFLPGYNSDLAIPELWMLDLFVIDRPLVALAGSR